MKYLAVFLVFAVLTIAATWPLALHLDSKIVNLQDGLLITWIINWSIAHPLNFDTNIFFPIKNTLAFSEIMLPQALIAAPFVKIFGEPLLAYNINFLLGLLLTGFCMYLLLDYLRIETKLALASAIIFNFSPLHMSYLVHLQLFNFWPVLLTILFLLRQKRLLFIVFFVVSSLTTSLFFYFLLLVVCFLKPRYWIFKTLPIAIAVTLPFLVPYYLVSWQWHYVRPITDAIHGSLAPSDLITQFFPGYALFILFFLAYRSKIKSSVFFAGITIFSFVLSLGPALHLVKETVRIAQSVIIPLPYAFFYYLLPGFAGFRTPSRWIILSFAALLIYLSLKIQKVNKKTFVIMIFAVIFTYKPIVYFNVPKIPEQNHTLLEKYPNVPVIYFPIYGWFNYDGVYNETLRMYFSTANWNPMFNGYSGFSPQIWEDQVRWLQKEYPSEKAKNFLKSIGVKLVIYNDKIYEL